MGGRSLSSPNTWLRIEGGQTFPWRCHVLCSGAKHIVDDMLELSRLMREALANEPLFPPFSPSDLFFPPVGVAAFTLNWMSGSASELQAPLRVNSNVLFFFMCVCVCVTTGCSSSPAPSLWRRTSGWWFTTTTCWPKTRRSGRLSSTWRTASCPNTELCAACRSHTACEWNTCNTFLILVFIWTQKADRISNSQKKRDPCLTLSRRVSRLLAPVWTSGGISWHPGNCCTECVSGGTSQNPSTRKTRWTLEGSSTRRLTLVSHAHQYSHYSDF